MKIAFSILLVALTALAVASGIAKIALTPNDAEFFGKYGFSDSVLIAFGVVQLVGGMLLPWRRTRFAGAAVVAFTFFISLVLLIVDGNVVVSVVTAVATLLLLLVMKVSWTARSRPA